MEYDLGTPNPAPRHDLPKRRRRWPKVVGALLLVLILFVAFLPQILRTGPGKQFLGWYLGKKLKLNVTIEDVQTSWSGPTTITNLWARDHKEVRLGIKQLTCSASLWQIIKGDYALGDDARCDGLYLDYVLDYGDGRAVFESVDRGDLPPGQTPSAPVKRTPWPAWGKVRFTNAIISLTRGQVTQAPGYPTVYETARVSNVNGTLDMRAGGPWTVDLAGAMRGATPDDPPGTVKLTGTLNLGTFASFADPSSNGELSLEMRQTPSAPLLWVVHSRLSSDDYRRMFGPTLHVLDARVAVGEGQLRFQTLRVAGKSSDGGLSLIEGRPVVDLTAQPAVLSHGAQPLRLSVQTSPGLAQTYLAWVNPFLRDAASGRIDVSIDKLSVSIGPSPGRAYLSGVLASRDVKLQVDADWYKGFAPTNLTGQWAQLADDAGPLVALVQGPVAFTQDGDWTMPQTQTMTLDGLNVALRGGVSADQRLKMTALIQLPSSASGIVPDNVLVAPLVGAMESPRIDISAAEVPPGASRLLADLLAKHLKKQADRHIDRLRNQGTIDSELERIRAAVGLPGTRPATRP